MRTALLLLLLTLIPLGDAFAQSTEPANTPQKQQMPSKPKAGKEAKETDKDAKKRDNEAAKSSAKKRDNAQNQVNAQAYRTTVRKP